MPESTIIHLSTRVRQLILQYEALKKENDELRAQIAERDNTIVGLNEVVDQKQKEYQSLKTAKVLEVSDGDLAAVRDRLAKLIRDVNQCITLIGEKE